MPVHHQDLDDDKQLLAKVIPSTVGGWDAPPKLRFAIDSPLEGAGFEPSVPRLGCAPLSRHAC